MSGHIGIADGLETTPYNYKTRISISASSSKLVIFITSTKTTYAFTGAMSASSSESELISSYKRHGRFNSFVYSYILTILSNFLYNIKIITL